MDLDWESIYIYVVIIQFLKGRGFADSAFIRRMEPEIRLFHFENFIDKNIGQCYDIKNKIEVAYFKSTPPDVAGTGEGEGKGHTPKGLACCGLEPWVCSE